MILPSIESQKRRTIAVFMAMAVVSLVAFFLVKFNNVVLIEYLFNNQRFELLNRMAGIRENQTLSFYAGRLQETFFGPLSQLISGGVFAFMMTVILKDISLKGFGISVFFYLLITKLEVLFYPPYGDAIGGPFAEAIWLYQNSFDYLGLYHQPGYAVGGPKAYVFSIFPGYLAILLKLIPNTKLFLLINHLIFFMMASVIVTLVKEILSSISRNNFAVLVSLVLLYQPLFQSQTEAINMELPCTFFAVLSAYALIKKRIHSAGISTALSALVKGSGIIAPAGFVLMSIYLFLSKSELRFKPRLIFWSLGLSAVALFEVFSKYLLNDQHVSAGMVNWGKGWPSLNHMYIFYIYIISLAVFIVALVISRLMKKEEGEVKSLYASCVMFLFAGLWFMLFFNFLAVSPRYRVLAYPFVVACAWIAFSLIIRLEWMRVLGLITALMVSLWSSYGYFEGPLPGNYHVLTERSLEYRNDLILNQKLVKTLEEKYSQFTIGAPFIMAQILALKELGYVEKDLKVMIYGFNCLYGGIENFPGLMNLDIGKTIYIEAQVDHDENSQYPINLSYDKIIEVIEYGDKEARLFMGGAGINQVYQMTQYLRRGKNLTPP